MTAPASRPAHCARAVGAHGAVASCAVELPAGATPPEWVQLMTPGALVPRDGRAPWTLGDPAAVVEASRRYAAAAGTDLVIDYEHQTDRAAANGQPAPAAGWIQELRARPDGIWARVEWTAAAAERLHQREYRYLSPTFEYDKARRVTRILRAALTNDPALHLTALAGADHPTDEDPMDALPEDLLAALGLEPDADTPTAIARARALTAAHETARTTIARAAAVPAALAQALGLPETATPPRRPRPRRPSSPPPPPGPGPTRPRSCR